MDTYIQACMHEVHACIHTYVHAVHATHTYTACIRSYTHTHTHTYTHTCTHTYLHTHTHGVIFDICMVWYEIIHPSGRLSRQSRRMFTFLCWNSEHRSTGSSLAQMLTETLRSTSKSSWYVRPLCPFSPTALARLLNALSWIKLDNGPSTAALFIHAARGTKDAADQPKP